MRLLMVSVAAGFPLLLAGCLLGDRDEPVTREEAAEAAESGEDLCDRVDEPRGCDLCLALEFYGDGVCDWFCQEADPDCVCTAGLGCDAGLVCDYEPPSCGEGGDAGFCRLQPDLCELIYQPVCGCDGQTYSNECVALANGVDAAAPGPCEVAVP